MDKPRATTDAYGRVVNGHLGLQPDYGLTRRAPSSPARRIPDPVSYSSDVTERDRYYRAASSLYTGGELVATAFDRVEESDRRMQQARDRGVSPLTLSLMERMHVTYGISANFLVEDYLCRPYERW
ncbi:hypothetical protein [Amycolatopsis sp. CA-126428]|uniref:hypothetical protein n=1 Tax=Amycolatopsis sp. CA-126428 TaxID=2073158 RepID=UPI000CD07C24|nr:hypothetical protein [Amycolatopsis sp. CA-126428]